MDPGEYGMENFSCRAVCLFLFTLSVMHEMLAEVQSFSVALAVVAVVAEAVAVVSLPAVIAVTVLLPKLLPLQALLLSVMLWLWLLVLYLIRYCFLLLLVFFDYCCWIAAVCWTSFAAKTVKRPPRSQDCDLHEDGLAAMECAAWHIKWQKSRVSRFCGLLSKWEYLG